jgi:uncharacterized protein (TIGR00369 family)
MNLNKTVTISWEDPKATLAEAAKMSGLEYMQKMLSGNLPIAPIGAVMNISGVECTEGSLVLQATPEEQHTNPLGLVHGGFLSTLMDSALGCCVHTMLPQGAFYSTIEMKVNFTRPLKQNVPIRCEAKVVHLGAKTAIAEAKAYETTTNKLVGFATETCLITPPKT